MQHHEAETQQLTAAGEVLSRYLHSRAGDFLRGLRLYTESGSDTAGAEQAADSLRAAARRISSTLYTYQPLFDQGWADHLRTELSWLSGTLAQEHACTARLNRLVSALARLSGVGAGTATAPLPTAALNGVPSARTTRASGGPAGGTSRTAASTMTVNGNGAGTHTADLTAPPAPTAQDAATPPTAPAAQDTPTTPTTPTPTTTPTTPTTPTGPASTQPPDTAGTPAPGAAPALPPAPPPPGALTVGASRAGALLDRQLTLARTRAHSAALQALGSSRFHAVADAVAVLASEVPLAPPATEAAADALAEPGEQAEKSLFDAVAALPLTLAAHPYNAEALVHGLSTASEGEAQDAPWHQVRHLLRLHRYAREVWSRGGAAGDPVLVDAGHALDRHREAAEASAAAANAARTPRIAPATAYALGVLHADQRLEVEAARYTFQQLWQQAAATAAR